VIIIIFLLVLNSWSNSYSRARVIISDATIVIPSIAERQTEKIAAQVLSEEVENRTGLKWAISASWPKNGSVVVLSLTDQNPGWPDWPVRNGKKFAENKPEGYRLFLDNVKERQTTIWILAKKRRGLIFGIGQLLRSMNWNNQGIILDEEIDIASSPEYPLRGHQLGYRPRANSYDAWDVKTYDQYIRELAFFGTNAIENIPFEDSRSSPHMSVPRDEMNIRLSEICLKYDLQYWIWTPADFDLNIKSLEEEALAIHKEFYEKCPRLDAVFFPGGDPGDNHPRLVMPFLEKIAKLLDSTHPDAKVWISLQGFDKEECTYFYKYLRENKPRWLGGVVAGPSSPSIPETRQRLPEQYQLRHYPDITHTVRCQYPVKWWDMAFNLILGRECPNPQPYYYALIHNWYASYTNGFITYSDGIHDDVNKIIWSARGWDSKVDVHHVIVEYARLFVSPDMAEEIADGIISLEKNWEGALKTNSNVRITYLYWKDLAKRVQNLESNWRWQLCLLRSVYDDYIRDRLIIESKLEREANEIMARATVLGAEQSMTLALDVLNRAITQTISNEKRRAIFDYCKQLFDSIGLQTSVKKYHASGGERGAILDYINYPLNNRWWLEDQFELIRKMESEDEKIQRLEDLAKWEDPGPGSYYDDIGNIEKSFHVVRGEGLNTDPEMRHDPNPGYWWWDNGFSRERLSWQVTMDWPLAVRYRNLEVNSKYVLRTTGYGHAIIRMNGERIKPRIDGKEIGEIKEFLVPEHVIKSGRLIITWDRPYDEDHLNWREQSRVAEIWLIKQ
jgi:hypothetical protein